jgi:hypothetical protein
MCTLVMAFCQQQSYNFTHFKNMFWSYFFLCWVSLQCAHYHVLFCQHQSYNLLQSEWWVNKADQMDVECVPPFVGLLSLRRCHVLSPWASQHQLQATNQPIEHHEFLQIVYKVANDWLPSLILLWMWPFLKHCMVCTSLHLLVSKCSCINTDVSFEKFVS